MASRGYTVSGSPSRASSSIASSPYQSYRSLSETDSPIFRSPRSSPDAELMNNYGTFTSEIEEEQLLIRENHFARADSTNSQGSISMELPAAKSRSSSHSLSLWGHLR